MMTALSILAPAFAIAAVVIGLIFLIDEWLGRRNQRTMRDERDAFESQPKAAADSPLQFFEMRVDKIRDGAISASRISVVDLSGEGSGVVGDVADALGEDAHE